METYEVDCEMADCWIDHAFLSNLVLVDLARIVPAGRCSSTLHLLGENDIEILVGCNRGCELTGTRSGLVAAGCRPGQRSSGGSGSRARPASGQSPQGRSDSCPRKCPRLRRETTCSHEGHRVDDLLWLRWVRRSQHEIAPSARLCHGPHLTSTSPPTPLILTSNTTSTLTQLDKRRPNEKHRNQRLKGIDGVQGSEVGPMERPQLSDPKYP